MLPEDRVSVDSCGATVVSVAVAVDEVRIRYVDGGLVRGESNSIRSSETVRYNPDITCRWIKAVHQLRKLRFRPKALLVAVYGICEPDRAVGMDDDVIGGIEGAGVVVVQEGCGFVRAFGFHVDEAARFT